MEVLYRGSLRGVFPRHLGSLGLTLLGGIVWTPMVLFVAAARMGFVYPCLRTPRTIGLPPTEYSLNLSSDIRVCYGSGEFRPIVVFYGEFRLIGFLPCQE